MLSLSRIITTLIFTILAISSGLVNKAWADDPRSAFNPLRLSYTNGNVSFWRYGADDWVEARINTPLAVGDALYTDRNADFELQAEGRAFIRADDETQISLVNQTPDFLQLKITEGRVSLDLRTLPSAGYTIELDTPNAVFTIDRTGYYRVDVDDDVHFVTRRGGRATMTPSGREAMSILPSEETVVYLADNSTRAETYAAPELDDWDQWNYDRTNNLIDALSERYLPSGIAGARDLDSYGSWRVMDEYGPVWVPEVVEPGWAPYSTGRWVWDSNYQWTWIDDAPWGWAPFHYGRWVYLGGYWAWAPGPVIVQRPVYSPALVAFFGVNNRGPGLGWVALSWGEPLVPWWGRRGFVGQPWWGGWGGPRVVNNIVVKQTTVVNVKNIVYANNHVSNAVITASQQQFGTGPIHGTSNRFTGQERGIEHIRGALPVQPNKQSLVADAPKGIQPPEQTSMRPVVATRPPQDIKLPWHATNKTNPRNAEQRYVAPPKPSAAELRRPDIGTNAGPERARPPMPQPFKGWKRQADPRASSEINDNQNLDNQIKDEPKVIRIVPPQIEAPLQGREPGRNRRNVTMPQQAQPAPNANQTIQQPMRDVPEITKPQTREARPRPIQQPPSIQAPAIAPQERPAQSNRVVPMQMPQQRAQESDLPDAVRNTPMPRNQAVPQAAQPPELRNLPGRPANRIYRGGNERRSEREPQPH